MKRFLSFLFCIVLLSGAAALAENAAPAAEPKGAAVQKVEITKGAKATTRVGETLKLKVKFTPAASTSALTWKSSDKAVATVSGSGVVKAKKAGTAKIVVRTANGKKDTIRITVQAPSNGKIHTLYRKKAAKIGEIEAKKYIEMTGDATDEALFVVHGDEYSWDVVSVYAFTYRDDKIRTILRTGGYGLDSIRYYSRKKALVLHYGGHGHERYEIYRLVNGKFRFIAAKGRESEAEGGDYTSPWYYSDGNDEITKKQYQALTANILKGKTVRIY